MDPAHDAFLARLRATFRTEASELVQTIATGLLQLERAPGAEAERAILDSVFRAAHSLKGAARAVDMTEVESRCQGLEDTFASWKSGHTAPERSSLDAVHRTLDAIVAAIGVASPTAAAQEVAPASHTPPAPPAAEETVRVAVAKLDARMLQSEEMLTAKLVAVRQTDELHDLARRIGEWRRTWGPGDAHLEQLKAVEREVAALAQRAAHDRQVVGKLVDDLLEDAKDLLVLPFATLVAPLPKLVRDLSREQGKEVDLIVHGAEIEIDKRVLDEMKTPLIHLLRNAVDHGIELPAERAAAGKPARAAITLAVSRVNGSKVQLLVADDGAGIDVERLTSAAIERGVLTSADAGNIDPVQAFRLAFEPDVSTSPHVTRVSGRGLGLAIVRESAERLGGQVALESEPRRGTTFRIIVPSRLTTFRGVLIEAARHRFVAPTVSVERVVRVGPDDIGTVEGRETLTVGGRAVALVRLTDVLELTGPAVSEGTESLRTAVLLAAGDQRVAFLVDAVHDEREVLVKPLRRPLERVRNVAGATVLASGEVALVLNVTDLLRSARRAGLPIARAALPVAPPAAETKSILLAEDSITSRMLIKGILEAAGYKVRTAVDGLEAWTLLRSEPFDLVVSDVEMPRLDGFELTARVRADTRYASVPIVLVTARETREDRERGIDVGADAYIVKSNFDQSHLLEAVRRLA